MLFTVFELQEPSITSQDQDLIKFVDISVAAWYSKYLSSAFKLGILPIAGQNGSRFYPDKELSRGEAAAYIFNAQHARSPSSSSSSSSSSSVSSQAVSSSSSAPADTMNDVSFPFADTGTFDAKKSVNYLFSLTAPRTAVRVKASITGAYASHVICRLYLIGENGFSDEYYLGVRTADTCDINVALRPGAYQLQIQPEVANVHYAVDASVGISDGNDGFVDAPVLKRNLPKTGVLPAGDFYDWYSFSVDHEMTSIIDLVGSTDLRCIIYTPSTVDQYGFTGPECGTPYTFVPGAVYMIGIGRTNDSELAKTLTYTVKWQ